MTTQPPDPNDGEHIEGGDSQPPPPPPPGSGGYQPPPPGQYGQPQPAYGAPGGQPYGMVPQTESKATIALVVAIVGFFTCALIGGIIALVLANQAESSIRASGGYKTGESQVRWARIIGWSTSSSRSWGS